MKLDNGATVPEGLRMRATYWADAPRPDDWHHDADAWRVRLFMDGRRMMFPYYMGSGHNGAEPTLADVLESLASDAASVDNARSFDDWCADFGYDTDSRKAEQTYRACVSLRDRLARVLGDAYDSVVFPPYADDES